MDDLYKFSFPMLNLQKKQIVIFGIYRQVLHDFSIMWIFIFSKNFP